MKGLNFQLFYQLDSPTTCKVCYNIAFNIYKSSSTMTEPGNQLTFAFLTLALQTNLENYTHKSRKKLCPMLQYQPVLGPGFYSCKLHSTGYRAWAH